MIIQSEIKPKNKVLDNLTQPGYYLASDSKGVIYTVCCALNRYWYTCIASPNDNVAIGAQWSERVCLPADFRPFYGEVIIRSKE